MKKISILIVSIVSVSALAETITVSVPACFSYEFQALESAIAQVRQKANNLCNPSIAIITHTQVEQTASCHGFNVSAELECTSR